MHGRITHAHEAALGEGSSPAADVGHFLGISLQCDSGRIAPAIIAGAHGAGGASLENVRGQGDIAVQLVIAELDVAMAKEDRVGTSVDDANEGTALVAGGGIGRLLKVVEVVVVEVVR